MTDTSFLRDGKWPTHVFYSVLMAGKLPTLFFLVKTSLENCVGNFPALRTE